MKKQLNVLSDYVILKVKRKKIKIEKKVYDPKEGKEKTERVDATEIEKVTIYKVGADVEGLKVGDEVILAYPALNDPSSLIFPKGYSEKDQEEDVSYLVSLAKHVIGVYK